MASFVKYNQSHNLNKYAQRSFLGTLNLVYASFAGDLQNLNFKEDLAVTYFFCSAVEVSLTCEITKNCGKFFRIP